jgi:hypothetical protein
MEDYRLPKQLLNYHPKKWRWLGRPLKRLLDDVNVETETDHPGLNSWRKMMTTNEVRLNLRTKSSKSTQIDANLWVLEVQLWFFNSTLWHLYCADRTAPSVWQVVFLYVLLSLRTTPPYQRIKQKAVTCECNYIQLHMTSQCEPRFK